MKEKYEKYWVVLIAIICILLYAMIGVYLQNKFDKCIDTCSNDDYKCISKCENKYRSNW